MSNIKYLLTLCMATSLTANAQTQNTTQRDTLATQNDSLATPNDSLATPNDSLTTPNDTLTMEKVMHDLPEVMVRGSRPIAKAERGMLTYDMPLLLKQLPADNAWEALTHIPGVSDTDGKMKLSGNEVTLIVNGQATTLTQEQLAERLKALPAAQLAKAEVMLAAPARYHVRGMAINIVTKNYAGTNQLAGQLVGGWKQGDYGDALAKGYLSVQRGRLGLDAQYDFADGSASGRMTHTANHPLGDRRVPYSDRTNTKTFGIKHNYRLGMGYDFGKNHRLDIAYTGEWKKTCSTATTTGGSTSASHFDGHDYLHNIDLNYALPFGLKLSGSYTHYRTPQQQLLDGTIDTGDSQAATERDLANTSGQTVDKWMFTADQNHSLSQGWGLSYGVSGQFTSNTNWQTTTDKEGHVMPDATSSVDVNERIWNLYCGFSKQLTKSLSLEATVAAEQYHSPLWDRWRVYPSLNALWRVNDSNVVNLSFSSDSQFPSYWSTMGGVFYQSTYTEVWGNPGLKPYSSYNVNLMWQTRQRYTLTAFASLMPDYSVQMPYQTSDRMAVIMKETNFNFVRSFGLQATAMFSAGKWLSGNAFVMGTYNHSKSDRFFDLPFDRRRLIALVGGNFSLKPWPTQDLRLVLDPFFQSKAIQGVYDIEPVFMMNAHLKWNFAGGKWGLRLQGENVFNNKFTTRSVQGNQDFGMKVANNRTSVTLAVIYKFGGYKEKAVKKVDTSRMGH